MSKLFSLLFLLSIAFPALSAFVDIPDAKFAEYLKDYHSSCLNDQGQLDTDAAGSYMEGANFQFIFFGLELTSMEGVQYFTHLKLLDVSYSNLTSLPELPPNLIKLHAFGNKLTSLPELPQTLEVLEIGDNTISQLPALPASLKEIGCYNNPGIKIGELPAGLLILDCSKCTLKSVPALPDGLEVLDISYNHLQELPELPNSLKNLDFSSNYITEFSEVPPKLEYLDMGYNTIVNLPPLPQTLTALKFNDIEATQINQPFPPNLRVLTFSYNKITEIPELPGSVYFFDCSWNEDITQLPALPAELTQLILIDNSNLKCLPALPEEMEFLDIRGTGISCLPNELPNLYEEVDLPLCGEGFTCGNSGNKSDTLLPPSNFEYSLTYITNGTANCAGETVDATTYCASFSWDAPDTAKTSATLSGYKIYYKPSEGETVVVAETDGTALQKEFGAAGDLWVVAVYSQPAGESEPSNILTGNDLPLAIQSTQKNGFIYTPSSGTLSLAQNPDGLQIRLIDAKGQIVKTVKGKSTITTSGLPKGIYFAEAVAGHKLIAQQKILK